MEDTIAAISTSTVSSGGISIVRISGPDAIIIGDKVWIGAHVHILKGVNIPDNSVIAYRTLLTKSFNEPNSIIGGEANRILKKNIIWK